MTENNPFKGKKHSEESRQLVRLSRTGKPSWNKGLKAESDNRVLNNIQKTKETKSKTPERYAGINNPNYKHGKAKENVRFSGLHIDEFTNKYLPFREFIFKRDANKCQKCQLIYKNKNLECHHMISKAKFPTAMYNNFLCITLCKKCHKNFHKKYGTTKFSFEDNISWLN